MEDRELSLVGHLEELRKRIILVLISFLVFMAAAFFYVETIYEFLIKDLDGKLAILGPSDVLWVYFMISGTAAVALTIPIAAYQAWRFVLPALGPVERKAALALIPALFLLFLTGIAFGYLIVFPILLNFMQQLSAGHFQMFYTTEKYFRFMMNSTLPFGVLFEMPAVILFLTSIGLINPNRLVKARKISYFALIVVSVLITPPDFISDLLVMVPLILLYEFSVSLSKVVYRRKLKVQEAGV
ncbi:twin-arginine translocase subunit TatC [Bacillus mangrovi]|uniref:Sec-independent protein translocase protein TatC n=1 Tax=Metabacillus mangrovi TaxID=1491830 RepID=A0A7X2S784_9BACI|nr:twin-arginine translocase subunit TatC [Metabacillus mangrovi]MTH54565.1 twin-arginine translocase subunit TatC [Metabacillus mangrovi]